MSLLRSQGEPSTAVLLLTCFGVGLAAAAIRPPVVEPPRRRGFRPMLPKLAAARVGRRLNFSAALLATSVLADSAVEHYRGAFHNRAMVTPLIVATATLAASLAGVADPRPKGHRLRDMVYAAAATAGFAGFAFHAYNIGTRPGGFSWLNFFYSAPIGAPWALALAGLLGRGAEKVRDTPVGRYPRILGLPAGRLLAGVSSLGLAGTVGEVALLHFRGAFHDPAMFLPVTLPPVASVLIGGAALRPRRRHPLARLWLRVTAVLGLVGACFHVFGITRMIGGWRNWSQNVLNGPPIPAPPSFTGLAVAGLAALGLLEQEARDG